jgi:hypothetical protein
MVETGDKGVEMSEARRTIIVHIWDDKTKPGGVDYDLSGYGAKNHEIKCSKQDPKCGMKPGVPHKVTFEIANRSSVDLCFPTDPARAMWVAADGAPCPKQACHQKGVVEATAVSSDGEQLMVENMDDVKGRYAFALNFIVRGDPDQSPLYSYDPIWNNQNGSTR